MNKLWIADCRLRNGKPFHREDAKSAKGTKGHNSSVFRSPSRPKPALSLPNGRLGGSNVLLFITLLSVIWLLSSAVPVYAFSGREVYEHVHEVWTRALNRTTTVTMTLYDKGGGKRTRTLMEYGKKSGNEAYKTLIVFKTPPDLKDVGFLIHARSFKDRDLWAYFPEYKRIRRIPDSNQDDSFFGSDFSYDDFGGPPELDDYTYDILREESIGGLPAYVVEVTPKVRRKFTRYVAWVSKEHWVHLRIDYYQDKELYRSGTFKDIKVVDGVPTPMHMEMENKRTGHRTEIAIENVRYNVEHPDSLFTQRSLERAGK